MHRSPANHTTVWLSAMGLAAAACLSLVGPASAHVGAFSHSYAGAMSGVPQPSAAPALPNPVAAPTPPNPSVVPPVASPAPVSGPPRSTAAPARQTSPAQTAPSSSAVVNPNTCNPETSGQCAEELLELQELQTPTEPAPKLFKEPTPAPPPAVPGISATAPSNQMGGADAPSMELQPELQPNELSSGGTPRQTLQFGGGGPTLADCMSIWDPTTDMSKSEWKATCVRTMNGVDLPIEGPSQPAAHDRRRPSTNAVRAPSNAEAESVTASDVQKLGKDAE